MSIVSRRSLQCFSIFQRSLIQNHQLPLREVLKSELIAETFQQDKVVFGIADEDVFTPAIALGAMVSQLLFRKEGRSCKAAASRVVSLLAQIADQIFEGCRSLCCWLMKECQARSGEMAELRLFSK